MVRRTVSGNLEIPGSRFARPGMTSLRVCTTMSYCVYINRHSGMVRKDHIRNLEIPGSRFARPGMTPLRVCTTMSYYVYIIASRKDGATYIGVTNDIIRRI